MSSARSSGSLNSAFTHRKRNFDALADDNAAAAADDDDDVRAMDVMLLQQNNSSYYRVILLLLVASEKKSKMNDVVVCWKGRNNQQGNCCGRFILRKHRTSTFKLSLSLYLHASMRCICSQYCVITVLVFDYYYLILVLEHHQGTNTTILD